MSKKSRKRYEENVKNLYDGSYTIGLDIGTSSVGWAVIDDTYQIPIYKGKKAWGVRRFDEGNTAENRRLKRGGRRRINRRKKRLEYLGEIFEESLNTIDENFLRAYELIDEHDLGEVAQYQRDITEHSLQKTLKLISHNQREYQELCYLYPTMFHLRYAIISNPHQKFDLRLVYLALHHIVKKRGHFIQEALELKELLSVDPLQFKAVIEQISDEYSEEPIRLKNEEAEQFINILRNVNETRNDRSKKVRTMHKSLEIYAKALLGMKFSLSNLLGIEGEDVKIEFDKELDAQLEEASDILDDTQKQYIYDLQQLYTSLVFEDVMKGSTYLSEAKVKEFDDYKAQLKKLKSLLKHEKNLYRKVFLTSKKDMKLWKQTRQKDLYKKFCLLDRYNYSDVNSKVNILDHEKFSKEIEKVLNQVEDSIEKSNMLNEVRNGSFLRKLNRRDNGTIPYQLHLTEAEKILKNQRKYYTFLDEHVFEKVTKLISFRIPYYVGPLINNNDSEFAWMEKNNENVRPWNFSETVDHATSAERFISRMVGNCTFLYQQKALPKHSLTYQLFEVLNEINVVKVDGKRISKPERDELFQLFLTNKKVTVREASKRLEGKKISGTSKETEFSSSLRSWQEMSQIIGEIDPMKVFSDSIDSEHVERFEIAEHLILWVTVFNNRTILKSKIEQTYPHLNNVSGILSLNHAGWGRLSNRFLVEMLAKNKRNIIQTMLLESKLGKDKDEICFGFQEVITTKKIGFNQKIEKYNLETRGDETQIKLEWIQDLAGSPAIKRAIWQAFQLIEELEGIFGKPKRIIIETAREDQLNRKRTKSRAEQWSILLNQMPEDRVLQQLKDENFDFRNLKVWLYLMQRTRCAYSNEVLHIDRISDYEIDHIIPYSISLDDSIDNKVLVKKRLNQDKAGHLMPLEVIPPERHAEMKREWHSLHEKGLISNKKYHNLLIETITPTMAQGFINRQLVETRQITKHVLELLKHRYQHEETKPDILGLKAQMSMKVQKELGIEKIRETNDKHHAVDAYMVAVIADFIFSIGKGSWIDGEEYWKKYRSINQHHHSNHKKTSWIVREMKKNGLVNSDGEVLTEADSTSVYQWLIKQIDDSRFCVTRKLESNGDDRKFWNETLYSPKSKVSTLPKSVGKQYLGVYSGVTVAETIFCSLSVKKGKKYVIEYRLESISQYERNQPKKELLNNRFIQELGEKYQEESVRVIKRLPLNTLILLNDYPVHLLSKKEVRNAKQIHYSQNMLKKMNALQQDMKIVDVLLILNELEEKIINCFPFVSEGQLQKMKTSLEDIKDKINSLNNGGDQSLNSKGEVASFSPLAEEIRHITQQMVDVLHPSSKRVDDWSGMGRLSITVLNNDNLKLISQSITGLNERIEVIKRNGEYVY